MVTTGTENPTNCMMQKVNKEMQYVLNGVSDAQHQKKILFIYFIFNIFSFLTYCQKGLNLPFASLYFLKDKHAKEDIPVKDVLRKTKNIKCAVNRKSLRNTDLIFNF